MAAGAKVYFTVGGTGRKPHEEPSGNIRSVAPGRFSKGSRGKKSLLSYQTRKNKSLSDGRLRNMTPEEIVEQQKAFEEAQLREPSFS